MKPARITVALSTLAVASIVTLAVVKPDAPSQQEAPEFAPMATSSMHDRTSMRRVTGLENLTTSYGTYGPGFAFVRIPTPANSERIIVARGECRCITYPAAVTKGELFSVIPIAMDGRDDQSFDLRLQPGDVWPYAEGRVSELQTVPVDEVDVNRKRRSVRP